MHNLTNNMFQKYQLESISKKAGIDNSVGSINDNIGLEKGTIL